VSKQTPDVGKPHSIADHEGIVAIQAKADGERVEIEIVEEPTDVGKEEIADLGLLVKRGIDFPQTGFSGL
jgi:hypothetical protein